MRLEEDLVSEIIGNEEAVDKAQEQLTYWKKQLRDSEQALVDAMAANRVSEVFQEQGRMWSRECKTYVVPATGMTQDVVDWIRENGGEDLVSSSMHPHRRDKFLRDTFLDEHSEAQIPEEVSHLLKVTELTKLKGRRA